MEDFYANVYIENCNAYPPELLRQYRGKHVAWSMDGKEIVASAGSHEELAERIKKLGRSDVVRSFIDPEPEIATTHSVALETGGNVELDATVAKT